METRRLEAVAPPAQGPSMLRHPGDDVRVDAHALTFEWEGPAHQDFSLEIARDADFTDVVARVPTGTSTSVTVYDLFRPDGARYFWRVLSSDDMSSATRSFVAAPFEELAPTALEPVKTARRVEQTSAPKTGPTPAQMSVPEDRHGVGIAPPAYRVEFTSPRLAAAIVLVMLISFILSAGIIFMFSLGV